MRLASFSLAALVVLSACALSACAAPGAGTANGWAAPAADRAERADRPPRRARPHRPAPLTRPAADRETRRAERRSEARRAEADRYASIPATIAALQIPVEGIDPSDLKDSFTAPRSGGRTHNAIDIAAPTGTPLYAVTDGRISRKHWNRLGGRTLYLTSADGSYDFYYAHLDSYADGLEIGSVVRRGDLLGTVGATGNARGPHLHFQILRKAGGGRGTPVNPFALLTRSQLYASR